ncbi:sulfur carrier protein ThiS [Marinicrinis lubricantis]|uniref:Sulfur carrier protein ThiS n=1 Tax=Marinicrinis lubricantis TaxID=2086470 RepID=A0ABW1INZ3_9BACL
MVKLRVNGDTLELPDTVGTVSQLLSHFGLDGKIAIVELNEQVLEKSGHDEARLTEGDRVEIVHFVGGG